MIDRHDIANAFRGCGIKNDDVIMLHADSLVLAQMNAPSNEARFAEFFNALENVIGPEGTVIMPTFSYSITKGEVFDSVSTPSTVGVLTEYFRRLPGVLRSRHPLFSIAARGTKAEIYVNTSIEDCFGPHSPYALLQEHNAWLVCLGCSLNRLTFVHYAEQHMNVEYRYFKEFAGEIREASGIRNATVRYFVRDLNRETDVDLDLLKAELDKRGALRRSEIGRVGIYAVRANDFMKAAQYLVAENPVALIRERLYPRAAMPHASTVAKGAS